MIGYYQGSTLVAGLCGSSTTEPVGFQWMVHSYAGPLKHWAENSSVFGPWVHQCLPLTMVIT
jgi:hypothetical protein